MDGTTHEKAFEKSEYIKRSDWQGKFMHNQRGNLIVSDYPGGSYEPRTKDLLAEDWVPFEFSSDTGVMV